jgi:hypothetical protein
MREGFVSTIAIGGQGKVEVKADERYHFIVFVKPSFNDVLLRLRFRLRLRKDTN